MSAETFRPQRGRNKFVTEPKKSRFSDKPATHGGGAAALSWIGAGLFIIGIIVSIASETAFMFWVLGGLAVQLWIVSAIIRPLEAIWTLLNERLPKS